MEFGRRLHDLLLAHQELIYSHPSLSEWNFKPNRININKQVMEELTRIQGSKVGRVRIGQVLKGTGPFPTSHEVRALLKVLTTGGVDVDIDAWMTRAGQVTSTPISALDLPFDGISPGEYDAQSDGLFVVNEWSPARPMSRERIRVEFMNDQPRQTWVPPKRLRGPVRRGGGELVFLTGFDIDHRECPETQECVLRFAPSTYADARVLMDLRMSDPGVLAAADAALNDGRLDKYVATAIPTSFNINVVPVSSAGRVLCVRRSSGVGSAPGSWTVGVIETMKRSDIGVYELAFRACLYELGLDEEHITDLHLTWLGIYRPVLRGHLVAVVRVGIPTIEAIERARRARESHEAGTVTWMDLNELLAELLPAHSNGARDGHPLLQGHDDRVWVDHARLAAVEAWRFG